MATEFLKKLPGIDSHNIHQVTRNVRSLTDLCKLSEEDLKKFMGPKNAKELKVFLDKKVEVVKA